MADYDLVIDESLSAEALGRVNAENLREQLSGLVSAVGPLMEEREPGGLSLDGLEIGLTLTAEGKLAFLAKAGVEASIKLTFKRPAT